ncbi:MAG: sigma factor-like helix-turn-helix DNA-binding protein, partial [Planctomycetota bacterium]
AVIEELPYAAIAEALDIPLGTVKSRMHSAVARVRGALDERERVAAALRARGGPAGGGMQA